MTYRIIVLIIAQLVLNFPKNQSNNNFVFTNQTIESYTISNYPQTNKIKIFNQTRKKRCDHAGVETLLIGRV